jgi:hypothetical protein
MNEPTDYALDSLERRVVALEYRAVELAVAVEALARRCERFEEITK